MGKYKSFKTPFAAHGYCEGRYQGPVNINGAWCMAVYDDIASAIEVDEIASVEGHFDTRGYAARGLPITPPNRDWRGRASSPHLIECRRTGFSVGRAIG